jgi:hypothetical protein
VSHVLKFPFILTTDTCGGCQLKGNGSLKESSVTNGSLEGYLQMACQFKGSECIFLYFLVLYFNISNHLPSITYEIGQIQKQ